ncbi:MAG: hypothetical protein J5752_00265 [Clostridiales bacterium]|nr:hypothetical protein [Clostridiales bacterium]
MIRKFNEVEGRYIERVEGQERFAYSLSDTEDFYDMIEWQEKGGYQGAVISFYDLESGEVFTPFPKKRNVMYGRPVFLEGKYFFLQGDFDEKKITLYSFTTPTAPVAVTQLDVEKLDLLNLKIVGEKVHIISHDEKVHGYYPEEFAFDLEPNETVELIADGKVYVEAWIEEGWDCENDCPNGDYRFYHKLIAKDFEGNVLSEEVGQLYHGSDGTWWVS